MNLYIYGTINNTPVICASGRFHYYEGYSFDEAGSIISIFNSINTELCIITNSSGCLDTSWEIGSLMLSNKIIITLILFSIVYLEDVNHPVDVDSSFNNIDEELFMDDNLFEELLTESKLFYADAIMSDLQGDSLNALYYFDNLFAIQQSQIYSSTHRMLFSAFESCSF